LTTTNTYVHTPDDWQQPLLTSTKTLNGLSYQSNYASGLRIIDVSGLPQDPAGHSIEETGFFDVHPEDDGVSIASVWSCRKHNTDIVTQAIEFLGTWSNYPYFKSEYILVNSIERGIFTVKYTGRKAKYAGGRKSEWMEVGDKSSGKPGEGPSKGPGKDN
jgi:hypothetical protein